MDATQVELVCLTLKIMIDREKLLMDKADDDDPPLRDRSS